MGILEKYNEEYLTDLVFFGQINFTVDEQEELIEELRNIILKNDKILGYEDRTIMILALICILRKWNGSELNFWEFILKRLDLRISYPKVFYDAINQYLIEQKRKVYRTFENKTSYYSTLLAQSLGQKESMFVLFDLLYLVFEESLLRDYKQGDSAFKYIAENLKSKINHQSNESSDVELQIGSGIYKLKSSIRMMIDQDTERFIQLVDLIFSYFDQPKKVDHSNYLHTLLWEWKEKNKENIYSHDVSKSRNYEIDRWVPRYLLINNNVVIEIPNIRISKYSNYSNYYYKLFVNEELIIGKLTVGGNVVLRYIKNDEIIINLDKIKPNSELKISIQFYGDDRKFFDSCSSLFRTYILFNGTKETFSDELDPKNYTLFTAYEDEISNKNVEYIDKFFYSLYIDVDTYFDFKGKVLVASNSENNEKYHFNTYVNGEKINSIKYNILGTDQKLDIYRSNPTLRFYYKENNEKLIYINISQKKSSGEVLEYSIEQTIKDNDYFALSNTIDNIPSQIKISVIDKNTGRRFNVFEFLVHSFTLGNDNKIVYGSNEAIKFKNERFTLSKNEKIFRIPYKEGELLFTPKYLSWNFGNHKDQNNMLSEYIWHLDIPVNSFLKIETNFDTELIIKLGSIEKKMQDYAINFSYLLDSLTEFDKIQDKLIASVIIQNIEYNLFEVRIRERFESKPYIQKTEFGLLYDFSRGYIGSKNSKFNLELVSNDREYTFNTEIFGEIHQINIVDDNYNITLVKLDDDLFNSDDKIVFEGNISIGDPMFFSYRNLRIKLKKCRLNIDKYEKTKLDNHSILLSNLEHISELGVPVYNGILVNSKRKDDVLVEIYNKAKINIGKIKSNKYFKFNYNLKTKSLSLESANNKEIFEIEDIYFEIERDKS